MAVVPFGAPGCHSECLRDEVTGSNGSGSSAIALPNRIAAHF